jgi:imidazolonepropionase
VRELLDVGAALALATDCNPGTSPVVSMPEVMSSACTAYGMTPLGALAASTIDPAFVLGISEEAGSLEAGKRADFVVLDAEDVRMVPYRPGHNPVIHTFVGGERVGGR